MKGEYYLRYYLQLMRVHHYIKNILIFLPLVFSGNLFNVKLFKYTIGGFLHLAFFHQ